MGRPERPIDPDEGPLARFACDLRELRRQAGGVSYQVLARKAGYSVSTLSAAASGKVLPTLSVTLAYVGGCRGDTAEWERRWTELAGELAEPEEVAEVEEVAEAEAPVATAPRSRRRLWLAAAAVLVLAALAAYVALTPSDPGTTEAAPVVPSDETPPPIVPPTSEVPPPPPSDSRETAPPESAGAGPVLAAGKASTGANLPHPAAAPVAAPTAQKQQPVLFGAVAGDGCPDDGVKGVWMNDDEDGASGWTRQAGGGWAGDGCDGSFRNTPGSGTGSPGKDAFVWWFQQVPDSACTVAVHTPAGAAGTPAHYSVLTGSQAGEQIATFTIDQPSTRGSWVTAGAWRSTGGRISIRLTDQDDDEGDIAADAVSLTCH